MKSADSEEKSVTMVMNFRFHKFSWLTEQVFDLQEKFRFMEFIRVVICGCPMLTEISEGKVAD